MSHIHHSMLRFYGQASVGGGALAEAAFLWTSIAMPRDFPMKLFTKSPPSLPSRAFPLPPPVAGACGLPCMVLEAFPPSGASSRGR